MIGADIILDDCWGVLGVYWLYSALGTKQTAVGEGSGLRVFRLSILVITLSLLLSDWLRLGGLGRRFVPDIPSLRWFGVGLTAAGAALAIWARQSLGRNWSDKVVLKVDHELIRSGPYRYLRHPIYGGVLLAVAGTALAIGEWRGMVALVLLGTNYSIKAIKEEKILASKFGEAFAEHRRATWFLLPGL
ncbi:MAG: isoprenylcysteine carboxylmethyltransferase family protein [Terriglobales bacterium]|jgi:protein-S-isoprenylcysteine O-methyltransferase Ste14